MFQKTIPIMAIRWQGLEEDGQHSQLSFCVSEVLRGGWRSGYRPEYIHTYIHVKLYILFYCCWSVKGFRLLMHLLPILKNSALQYFTWKIKSIKVYAGITLLVDLYYYWIYYCRFILLLLPWKGVGARKKAHVSRIRAIALAILHHKEIPCLPSGFG